jgi:hypothetical protein
MLFDLLSSIIMSQCCSLATVAYAVVCIMFGIESSDHRIISYPPNMHISSFTSIVPATAIVKSRQLTCFMCTSLTLWHSSKQSDNLKSFDKRLSAIDRATAIIHNSDRVIMPHISSDMSPSP